MGLIYRYLYKVGFKFITELILVNKSQYTDMMIHIPVYSRTNIYTHDVLESKYTSSRLEKVLTELRDSGTILSACLSNLNSALAKLNDKVKFAAHSSVQVAICHA